MSEWETLDDAERYKRIYEHGEQNTAQSMVERVARAIAGPWANISNVATPEQMLELMARAAIQAMREPTDTMAGVHMEAWIESNFEPTPEDVWKAMIDEALR